MASQGEKKQITLKVKDSNGGSVTFKVKTTTKFSKIINAYASKMNTEATSLRFIFEGNRCGDTDTPESMGIEDGDQIDVKQAVEGGSY